MLNFGPTFRALTSGSPITTALYEARRMARRHLETGGATTAARRLQAAEGFLVPSGIDTVALAKAIEAKLRAGDNAGSSRSGSLLNLLERRADGRIVVPRVVLAQLGAGNAARGEQLVERLMSDMRGRRVPVASQARQR